MRKERTWKILDWGEVADKSHTLIPYSLECGHEAMLPVHGTVIAETGGGGLIFDHPQSARMPVTIQCRQCRKVYTNAPEEEATNVR